MKIFVGNLHSNASEAELRDLFCQFGEVSYITIIRDTTGKSQGCAFVEMKLGANGQLAIKKLNRLNFMQHFLDVHEVSNKP